MNSWDIMAPHAKINFDCNNQNHDQLIKELAKIAGCKYKNGYWIIPLNAIEAVESLRQRFDIGTDAVSWLKEPGQEIQSWADIEAALRESGEVQPWVLDGFLLKYQQEALNFAWTKDGVHLWHPTGCIEGRSRLLVQTWDGDQLIKEERMQIAELHREFCKDVEGRVYKTRSVREDAVFWNTIQHVHACGDKELFLVSSRGNNVMVSAGHRFAVREDDTDKLIYKRADQLTLNDVVYMCPLGLRQDAHGAAPEGEYAVAQRVEAHRIDGIARKGNHHTYDLTMYDEIQGGENNYVTENFVVHNSGKTLTGILASLSVKGPLLIVTRAASRIQYAREVEKFTTLRAFVVRPASEVRKKSQTMDEYLVQCKAKNQRPVLILGWESLTENMERLAKINPGVVVYDEAHRGKNSKRWDVVSLADLPPDPIEATRQKRADFLEAKEKGGFIKENEDGRKMLLPHVSTASAAAALSRLVKKRICTTATPVKNRVNDLWSQLDLAEPNAWGAVSIWQDRYCDRKPGKYGGFDASGESNIDELNLRIKSVAHILSQYETHRDLPAKRRQSFYIAPEDQCKPVAGFAREIKQAQQRGSTAVLEARLAESASRKRKAVLSLVEDHLSSNHKIVVFTARKADCELFGDEVKKLDRVKSDSISVWSAHGETSVKNRQAIVDAYMAAEGPCVLVATGQAFGESLNLQDTDAAIFLMLPYDPGSFKQWEGRFSRHGQRRPVTIYYAIAVGTVDEHVAALLIDKLPAVEKVAKDEELAAAERVLSGIDENQTPEEFAQSVLSALDFD